MMLLSKIKRVLTVMWFSVLAVILFLLLNSYVKTHNSKLIVAVWFYSVLFISIYFLVVLVVFACKHYTRSLKGFTSSIKMYQIKGKEKEVAESLVSFEPPVTRFKGLNKLFEWIYSKNSFMDFWVWFKSPSLDKKTYIKMYAVAFIIFALWCFYPQLMRVLGK